MNKVVRAPSNIVNPASRCAALSFSSLKVIAALTDALRASPLSVKLLPDSTISGRQSNGGLDSPLLVEIQREPLNGWERLMKRALDLVLAVVAAVLLAPVLLMTAVAIKIDSNGPVLFRQRRVGF